MNLYKEILECHGVEVQTEKLINKMADLTVALYGDRTGDIAKEMGSVKILLEQLTEVYPKADDFVIRELNEIVTTIGLTTKGRDCIKFCKDAKHNVCQLTQAKIERCKDRLRDG